MTPKIPLAAKIVAGILGAPILAGALWLTVTIWRAIPW